VRTNRSGGALAAVVAGWATQTRDGALAWLVVPDRAAEAHPTRALQSVCAGSALERAADPITLEGSDARRVRAGRARPLHKV
jgi:hypothetical protein